MNSHERIVLRLEVDLDADPITGTLSRSGHAEQRFTGWLALTDVIESIRTTSRAQAEPDQELRRGALDLRTALSRLETRAPKVDSDPTGNTPQGGNRS
jgi:hypothetical protein